MLVLGHEPPDEHISQALFRHTPDRVQSLTRRQVCLLQIQLTSLFPVGRAPLLIDLGPHPLECPNFRDRRRPVSPMNHQISTGARDQELLRRGMEAVLDALYPLRRCFRILPAAPKPLPMMPRYLFLLMGAMMFLAQSLI